MGFYVGPVFGFHENDAKGEADEGEEDGAGRVVLASSGGCNCGCRWSKIRV